MANTRRMNRLEELGRVDAERAYTRKGKKNLKAEKKRIVGELKRKKGGPVGKSKKKMPKSSPPQVDRVNKKLLEELRKRKPSGRINLDDLKRILRQRRPKKDINRYDEYMRSRKNPPKTMKARGGGIAKRGMGKAK